MHYTNLGTAQTQEHHIDNACCQSATEPVTEVPLLWKSSQILVPSQFFREFIGLLGVPLPHSLH